MPDLAAYSDEPPIPPAPKAKPATGKVHPTIQSILNLFAPPVRPPPADLVKLGQGRDE